MPTKVSILNYKIIMYVLIFSLVQLYIYLQLYSNLSQDAYVSSLLRDHTHHTLFKSQTCSILHLFFPIQLASCFVGLLDTLTNVGRVTLFFYSMNFSTFSTPPKRTLMIVLFYLARHVVVVHLEQLQLVPNLLKIFGTPSSVFVQLG